MNRKKPELAYRESIADLWGYPEARYPERPCSATLCVAIAGEAEACLHSANWEDRIRRIENCLVVIKERIRRHWESWHRSELDRLSKKDKESDSYVG